MPCPNSVNGCKAMLYDADVRRLVSAEDWKRFSELRQANYKSRLVDFEKDGLPSELVCPCPSCGVIISKNGGCPSVDCVCGHTFRWMLPEQHMEAIEHPRPNRLLTHHFFVNVVKEEWKLDTLCDIAETGPFSMVVYCRSRRKMEWLTAALQTRGFTVQCTGDNVEDINGSRHLSMWFQAFINGSCNILVTSTSLDQDHIARLRNTIMINYDMPRPDQGRQGYDLLATIPRQSPLLRPMMCINLIIEDDMISVHAIEERHGITMEELPMNFVDLV